MSAPAAGSDVVDVPASVRDPAAAAPAFAVDVPPSVIDPDDPTGATAPDAPPRDNDPDPPAATPLGCGASSSNSGTTQDRSTYFTYSVKIGAVVNAAATFWLIRSPSACPFCSWIASEYSSRSDAL